MTITLHLDVETRSPVELNKTGAYVYFDHPDTDLWCAAYAFGDNKPELWVPGEPCPDNIWFHVSTGGVIEAHNAAFERLCINKKLGPKYGWPVPAIEQYRCTMARCYAQALPGALENACDVTQTPIKKDVKGSRIMKTMAKPRKPRKDENPTGLLWRDEPDKLKILYEYCKTDVEAERALGKRILPLSDFEQQLWCLDQRINDRGVKVDLPLCSAAQAIVAEARERLDRTMRHVTKGAVVSTSAVAQLKAWLSDEHDMDFDSLSKDVIEEILVRDDLKRSVRRALELRQQGSKTSVSKVDSLVGGTQADGRSRGLVQYHAAATGRWGGRRFQPQNIKRPELDDVDTAIAFVRTGDLDMLEAVYA